MGKVYDWSEATRRERCVSRVRRQAGKGGRIMRWCGRRSGNVMKWQFGKGEREVSREGGLEFKHKIVLYCFREAISMQGFTAGI